MPDYMVAPTSRKKIKDFASYIRNCFGLFDIGFFPLLDFIEIVLPQIDPEFNFCVEEDWEMGNDQANYNIQNKTMKVRQSVYEGACCGNGRDRFTLAHEIGHYFMHNNIMLSRVESGIRIPAYRDPEWQANTFAAALLMPDHLIIGLTPQEIAVKCGTSNSAATIAYENLYK